MAVGRAPYCICTMSLRGGRREAWLWPVAGRDEGGQDAPQCRAEAPARGVLDECCCAGPLGSNSHAFRPRIANGKLCTCTPLHFLSLVALLRNLPLHYMVKYAA